jgi:[acyl-carrier-protein] S-malonyltransferase
MEKAFLFPGQGSQFIGMAKDLFDEFQFAKDRFKQAENILGYNLAEIAFEGPDHILKQTQFTQPSIFVHSVIINDFLSTKGIFPSAVAGHSLGEFSALVSAEVLSFEDTLSIVKVRANEMAKAGDLQPGSMAAILGADQNQLETICNQNGIVVPANLNAPGQVVISGEVNSVANAIKIAKDIGIRRALPLNVSGAFHSPLMIPARVPLLKALDSVNFSNAKVPIYQNYSAEPVTESDEIKSNLLKQLESPVRWQEIISNMNRDGFTSFLEVGPGKVLQGLNKRILADHNSFSIGTKEQVELYL